MERLLGESRLLGKLVFIMLPARLAILYFETGTAYDECRKREGWLSLGHCHQVVACERRSDCFKGAVNCV